MDLTNLHDIKELLRANDLWAKKYLGQNFLISKKHLEKIVESANIQKDEQVIEVGPGLGTLTLELLKKTKNVTSIELDKTLFPVLSETLQEHPSHTLIHQDALRFEPPVNDYKVVANIPYNITSPLINHFLQRENRPISMTLLIQKEVAEKICDTEKKRTVLSLQVALFGKATVKKMVPSHAFYPAPKVNSAILQIALYKKNDPEYLETEKALKMLKIAKQAFRQGRKKLSNTLPHLKENLAALGLLDARPQHLTISDWQKLSDL